MHPVLAKNRKKYVKFVKQLQGKGIVCFSLHADEHCGVFSVTKKSGALRFICDARRTDARFTPPPSVRLPIGEAFPRISLAAGQVMYGAGLDLKDYFHSMTIPVDMRTFFALPSLSAAEAGVCEVGGIVVSRGTLVYPCFCTLPMGFSWAMWAAQAAHEEVVARAQIDTRMVRDRSDLFSLDDGPVSAVYVDNYACFALSQKEATANRDKVLRVAEGMGFICHEFFEGSDFEFLGHCFRGEGQVIQLTNRRFWKLTMCLDGVLRRGRCTGDQLRIILGHLTWAFLLRRPMLSVFAAVYKFQQLEGAHRLWPTVIRELTHARNLLPLCHCSLTRQTHQRVYVSDACMSGYAVASTMYSLAQISVLASCDESWRFKQIDAPGARSHALASESQADEQEDWDSGFRPLRYRDALGPWQLHYNARFRGEEAIHVKEARGTIACVRRVARSSALHHRQHVVCGDNMSVALALAKGRCQDPLLLFQCRRAAAVCLAADLSVVYRWLPSEWNAADAGSRQWEPPKSHTGEAGDDSHVPQAARRPILCPSGGEPPGFSPPPGLSLRRDIESGGDATIGAAPSSPASSFATCRSLATGSGG